MHRTPAPGDDVVIPTSGAVVTHSTGTDTVNSITASAPFTLSGGTLTVAGNFSDSSAVTLSGGTLSNATVQARRHLQDVGDVCLASLK
jgi:hypothetical protein